MTSVKQRFETFMKMTYPTAAKGSEQWIHMERVWFASSLDATATISDNNQTVDAIYTECFVHIANDLKTMGVLN